MSGSLSYEWVVPFQLDKQWAHSIYLFHTVYSPPFYKQSNQRRTTQNRKSLNSGTQKQKIPIKFDHLLGHHKILCLLCLLWQDNPAESLWTQHCDGNLAATETNSSFVSSRHLKEQGTEGGSRALGVAAPTAIYWPPPNLGAPTVGKLEEGITQHKTLAHSHNLSKSHVMEADKWHLRERRYPWQSCLHCPPLPLSPS